MFIRLNYTTNLSECQRILKKILNIFSKYDIIENNTRNFAILEVFFVEIKLSVDRIEGGIAVCYGGDKKYELPAEGLAEGLIVLAEFDKDGKMISVTPLEDETEKRKKDLSARTKNIFKRNRK